MSVSLNGSRGFEGKTVVREGIFMQI